MTTPDTAVLIDGPSWWGDPSVTPEGRPVRLDDAADRSARRSVSDLEIEALEAVVAALPDGCLVLHTGGRGAGTAAGRAAGRRRLPVSAWPPFPGEHGPRRRTLAVTAALTGLAAAGWAVKAVVAVPESGEEEPEQAELVDLLRSHNVFVRYVAAADAPSLVPAEEPDEAEPDA